MRQRRSRLICNTVVDVRAADRQTGYSSATQSGRPDIDAVAPTMRRLLPFAAQISRQGWFVRKSFVWRTPFREHGLPLLAKLLVHRDLDGTLDLTGMGVDLVR